MIAEPSRDGSRLIRIVVVDDHGMVRAGIRSLIESYEDMTVVGEAENGEDALIVTREVTPDAVLMDANMPVMDGIAATREIKRLFPSVVVIALSVNVDSHMKERMLEAGASAYVFKDQAPDDLLDQIHLHCIPGDGPGNGD